MRSTIVGCVLASGILGASGCGSYWDLRSGQQLPIGCAGLLNYYYDADGDGWGEPDSPPTALCGPKAEDRLTASNDLDCDDSDPGVTGRAGAICPDGMAFPLGGSTCVLGRLQGQSEYVSTCDASPLVPFGMAAQDCRAWAGWETEGSTAGHRGLASLETENEYVAVVEEWQAGESGGEPVVLWVDLAWEGTLASGEWVWPGGELPTWIPPCGGVEPHPADFWPELVLGIPESDATLTEHLDEVRLALVYDGSSWCRGVPDAAGDAFGPREAHVMCERPRPNLSDYQSVPTDDGEGPGPGE